MFCNSLPQKMNFTIHDINDFISAKTSYSTDLSKQPDGAKSGSVTANHNRLILILSKNTH